MYVAVRSLGVDRSFWVSSDDLDRGLALLEELAGTGDGSAGTHPGDEDIDLSVGLLPDLGPRGLVVRSRVSRVEVLVGLEGAFDL